MLAPRPSPCTRRRAPIAVLVLVGIFQASPTGPVAAQSTDELGALDFRLAAGTNRFLTVDDGAVPSYYQIPIGAVVDYAHHPLVVDSSCSLYAGIDCAVAGSRPAIARWTGALHLQAATSFRRRVHVSLDLPLALARGDGVPFVAGGEPNTDIRGGTAFGLGDPRVHAKANVFEYRNQVGFAIAAFATAPVGQLTAPRRSIGEPGPTFGGHAVSQIDDGRIHLAANLGGLWRPSGELLGTSAGPEATYAGGGAFDLGPNAHLVAELVGATSFGFHPEELEARAGIRVQSGIFELTLGGAGGLLRGPGVPLFRAFVGVTWIEPRPVDLDSDGVLDDSDACPLEPEDRDGTLDADGCPESDNDGDGKLDAEDRCPNDAEDVDGFEDEDGCPDPDNDHDGVADAFDSCPGTPEDTDGDRDTDGCPESDRDRDGVPDELDRCPDEAEDTDGLADTDGCPEMDADGDHVPDTDDECPEQAGSRARRGCP